MCHRTIRVSIDAATAESGQRSFDRAFLALALSGICKLLTTGEICFPMSALVQKWLFR
jgi:hypothetical protein